MKAVLSLLLALLFSITHFKSDAQQLEFFWDTEQSIDCQRVQENEDGDYILIGNLRDSLGHFSSYILKLDSNFDTTVRIFENNHDDLLFRDFIVLPGNEYLIVGTKGVDVDELSNITHFSVFRLNSNFEVLFEKHYLLPEELTLWSPFIKAITNDDALIYVTARFLEFTIPGDYNVLIKLNDIGDTIQTSSFHSNYYTGYGAIYSIMNNNGNINGIYGFATGFSSLSQFQILEIDTNFNISYTEINNTGYSLSFSTRFTTKWLTDNTYLLLNSEIPDNSLSQDIFVAKFNTDHELVGEPIWVGRPDTSDWVPKYGMDWTDPDNIFVCAYQFVYHVPWEVNQLVALIDSSLNVKGMKYYGQDLNFGIRTLCATSDGGAILPVGQHDYNNPDIDMDLVVWKISSDDLITSASETKNPYDSDYLVFPNPGNDELNINTGRKGVILELFNEAGIRVKTEKLPDSNYHKINVNDLPDGIYLYQLTDNKGFSESGKWIKK